jgi:hypothetical protein
MTFVARHLDGKRHTSVSNSDEDRTVIAEMTGVPTYVLGIVLIALGGLAVVLYMILRRDK